MEAENATKDSEQPQEEYTPQADIVKSFYDAITSNQPEVVTDLVQGGLVTAETLTLSKETPLLAAVRANDPNMIRTLVSLGANINAYGRSPITPYPVFDRTPLQFAAQEGKLGMVKVLRELGADDSLVAPDGAIALRLAAENGHREIVEFLPAQRAGALKRWQVTHEKEMRRVRKILDGIGLVIKFFAWDIPKFFAWTVPSELWKGRHRIAGWCGQQIKKFPGRVKKAAGYALRGLKKIPKLIMKIPEVIKELAEEIWKVLKRIPKAILIILFWAGSGLKKVGGAIAEAFMKLFSLLHTAFSAIVSFFKAITWKDVVNGFFAFLRAVFVQFPIALWSLLVTFKNKAFEAITHAFGSAGEAIWFLFGCIFHLIQWLPKKIWQIIAACGRSIAKGWHEVLVVMNPKRM